MLENYGDFLDSESTAIELHVSTWTVRDWCRKGILPSVKVGNRVLVPKQQLIEFVESKMKAGVE
ncbi:MAG: helix-turn-helix domain-containing protein [Eggerthellaceae bacterium]|nr:helix-turn-helix domain-containing protein [Eggerthellaceae bacterium]